MTQNELKERLHYNPETGVFTRIKSFNNKPEAGWISTRGYHRIYTCKKDYPAHHLAWLYCYGYLPKQIDHINGIKTDNRIRNLREASSLENNRNIGLSSLNKSGFKGVHFDSKSGKWRARASLNNKNIHLGWFTSKYDAADAYKEFAKKHHREYYKPPK